MRRDRMAQVEQARRRLALFQQAQQAAPQQRGFGEVRLAFARPKQENGGIVGDLRDGFIEAGKIFGNLDRSHHWNHCRAQRESVLSGTIGTSQVLTK